MIWFDNCECHKTNMIDEVISGLCGLARSQGNGSGGLTARGQREDAVRLKLR